MYALRIKGEGFKKFYKIYCFGIKHQSMYLIKTDNGEVTSNTLPAHTDIVIGNLFQAYVLIKFKNIFIDYEWRSRLVNNSCSQKVDVR